MASSQKGTSGGKLAAWIAPTDACGFRFPKICSRFKIPEIANFDGKTGKMLIGYARGPNAAANRSPLAIPRHGTPDEVASLVVYLTSPEAGFVTGATYNIDGGWSA